MTASSCTQQPPKRARKAEELTERATHLDEADDARARWYLHTAVTRDNAHRAGAELRARGIDPDDTSDRVTAAEWLDAHQAHETAEDQYRDVHPDDIGVVDDDQAVVEQRDEPDTDTTREDDARPSRRVPSADDTAEAVARAQDALRAIEARQAAEREAGEAVRVAEDEARIGELARWSADDEQATDAAATNEDAVVER